MNRELEEWCKENRLDIISIHENQFEITGAGTFLYIEEKIEDKETGRKLIFTNQFQLNISNTEVKIKSDNQIDYLVFKFGDSFYYTKEHIKPELNIFKYLGKALQEAEIDYPYLGVHGGYEMCHGSRNYKEWCKKAKFLGIKSLGICEEHTLAGSLAFQSICEKHDINSIIGETLVVRDKGQLNTIKLFCKSEEGFRNLLRISNTITCGENKWIEVEELLKYTKDLVCILTPDISLTTTILEKYKKFSSLFYQIDFVEWASNDRDKEWLDNIKLYLDKFREKIEPILICDAYYLDQKDSVIQKYLNNIGDVGFKNTSHDQYFKSIDDIFLQGFDLFREDDERSTNLVLEGIEGARKLEQLCNFSISIGNLYLPKYEMNEEEKKIFVTNEDLFFELIDKGVQKRISGKGLDENKYWDRLDREIDIISRGGFIDYFLILWDVYRWCEGKNIYTGLGRGSAAGSLVAYLLGLTGIDPIHYNLLFERFLNDGRFKEKEVEVVIISTDEGDREVSPRRLFKIKRDSRTLKIRASELQEGDSILEYKQL